jgi:hypothetical protein
METTLKSSRTIPLSRWAGAAFLIGNVLFLANKFNEMSRLFLGRPMPDVISGQNPLLIFTGQVLLILGYVGYFQTYAPRQGRWGKNALRLLCAGGIMVAIGHVSFLTALEEAMPWIGFFFLLVLLGVLLLTSGLIWFGALQVRRPVLAVAPWLPLATGLAGFAGFFLFRGQEITATFLVFRTLFALGLIGLGVILLLETNKPQESVNHKPERSAKD